MELITSFLHQGASAVVPFVILLGLLIFVHEMGHFLVAKYYGVRVETFSLGFGKKIFQFKRGDTTYCLSLIPLGGYVKMFGDDPGADIAAHEKQYSYTHKPVSQRVAVVLAGPLMNFFFAILVFALMAVVGEQYVRPVVGDVGETSAAYLAGFRSGDKILQVNQQPIRSWEQLQDLIEISGKQDLRFRLERDGLKLDLTVRPEIVRNKNVMSTRSVVGEIDGLGFSAKASIVAIRDDASLARQAGFKIGDQIDEVNGSKIANWRQLLAALEAGKSKGRFEFVVSRLDNGKVSSGIQIILPAPPDAGSVSGVNLLNKLGLDSPDLYLAQVLDGTPAKAAGLQEGDHLVSLMGKKLDTWDQVIEIVKNYKTASGPIEVVILRDGKEKTFSMTPQLKRQMTPQGKEEDRFILGIVPTLGMAIPETFIQKASNPLTALWRGIELTGKWTQLTILGFVRLIQNEVSPKNLGGVISIAQVASRSFEAGLASFLSIMGIISINLFVVNLLPVPVLDGGHLVFYTLEAIRGKPLSLRKLEIAQQVGIILLFSLMAFALLNDFTRSFNL